MSGAWFRVDINIGDAGDYGPAQSWSLTHSEGQVTDGVVVLDGLRFGWSVPDGLFWPLQPNPMPASLAINLPAFVDEAWMAEGSPVAIEVTMDDDEGVAFAFYGRITDGQAEPRPRRTGVTLSLNAIDYTIDPAEFEYPLPADTALRPGEDHGLLEFVWDLDSIWGTFPDWPASDSAINIDPAGQSPRDVIDAVLLTTAQTLTRPTELGGGTDLARLIFAPLIDPATKQPYATGKKWAFDPVFKHPFSADPGIGELASVLVINASKLERASLAWARNKSTAAPNVITVTGPDVPNGPIYAVASNPGNGRPWGADITGRLDTVTVDQDRAEEIAALYLPDLTPARRRWSVPSLRWLLSEEDSSVLASLPLDLMPRWTQPEGDYSRSRCYIRPVNIEDLAGHLNPYDSVDDGLNLRTLLSGVTLTISGGNVALDFAIRHLLEPEA